MIERDKEYYNQKISDLYAVIENQEKIIRDVQEGNKQLKENYEAVLRQRDDITKNATETIEKCQQEKQQLKEDLEDYERIFDIWNKRKLINKFNKEFSKKMVKEERAKGNKIVSAIPDAEYVYKKYYEKVEQLDLYKSVIDKALKHTHEMLGFLENCVGGNEQEIQHCIKIFNKYLEILKGEK